MRIGSPLFASSGAGARCWLGAFVISLICASGSILRGGEPVRAQESLARIPEPDRLERQERIHARKELRRIEERLSEAEERAMQSEEVQLAHHAYMNALREAAMQRYPELVETFQRQSQLRDELEGSSELRKPAEERSPEFEEKLREFRMLREKANPAVQKVADSPRLRRLYQEYLAVLLEEMEAIEPETSQLMSRRAALAE